MYCMYLPVGQLGMGRYMSIYHLPEELLLQFADERDMNPDWP